MSEAFVYDEVDRRVWEEELAPQLPPRIYDAHSHTWVSAEHRSSEGADPSTPSVVEEYPLPELQRVHHALFPGRQVSGLLFGSGHRDTDFAAQGERIAEEARAAGYHSLAFAPPQWGEEELERQVRLGHLGFKPYWYLAGDNLDSVELADMISPAMLRVADRHHLIIMTHVPRTGRLADRKNIEGLHKICASAPNARFILAHLGRSYFIEAARFEIVADIPNLWADCSMVQDWEVVAKALSTFPPGRVLFGLDLPIAQEKGKLISVNGQRHFFTARPHPWSVHAEPGAYEVRCTLFAYEIIRALLRGAAAAGLSRAQTDALFWDNAQRLIASVEEARRD
ncbi:MAG: amidohydrolase family protein [Armatimonadota bacterium]